MVRLRMGLFAVGTLWLVLSSGTAFAAKPSHQACLGHGISGYAQGGASFGTFVAGLAQATDGVGDEIQAHLAGEIPDEMLPNSCND